MMNRCVLVTGSSRGIGRAIALRLGKDGFDVVVHCRRQRAQAEEVANAIMAMGRAARILSFDVADRAQAARARGASGAGGVRGGRGAVRPFLLLPPPPPPPPPPPRRRGGAEHPGA